MIIFKLKNGLEGYEMTKDIRSEYLGTGSTDRYDDFAVHIAGFEKGKVICSGRMYSVSSTKCMIDNVIVDNNNRLQYVGDTVLRALEDKAVQMMKAFIGVMPTVASKGFFEAEGYEGDEEMIKNLTKVRGCRGCERGDKK